jgi:hypothetical protein
LHETIPQVVSDLLAAEDNASDSVDPLSINPPCTFHSYHHECPKKTGSGNDKSHGKSNGKGRFQGKSNNCGRQGHKVDDCWDEEENKEKGPKGYKGKTAREVGAAVTDASKSVVFALTAHKKFLFPEMEELLKDANVWIADTGARPCTLRHIVKAECICSRK